MPTPPPTVVVPAETYTELLRVSEKYAALLASGVPRGTDEREPALTVPLLEKVTLVEYRTRVAFRQARVPALCPGTPPHRLRSTTDRFQAIVHIEGRRILIFRSGGGSSRLVVQIPIFPPGGGPAMLDCYLHHAAPGSDEEGSTVVLAADGRVVELGIPDVTVAGSLYSTLRMRIAATPTTKRVPPTTSPLKSQFGQRQRELSPPRPHQSPSQRSKPATSPPRRRTVLNAPSPELCRSVNEQVHSRMATRERSASVVVLPEHTVAPFPDAAQLQADRQALEAKVAELTLEVQSAANEMATARAVGQGLFPESRTTSPTRQRGQAEGPPSPPRWSGARHTSPRRSPSPPRHRIAHSPVGRVVRSPPHHPKTDTQPHRPARIPRHAIDDFLVSHPQLSPTEGSVVFPVNPCEALIELCRSRDAYFHDYDFDSDAVDPVLSVLGSGITEVSHHRLSHLQPDAELIPHGLRGAPPLEAIAWPPVDLGGWHVGLLAIVLQEFSSQGRDAQREQGGVKDMGGARFLIHPDRVHPEGVYAVQLFLDGKWGFVVVDDRIPCDPRGAPLLPMLAGPPGGLFLPLILKAMAKFAGGYAALLGPALLSRKVSPGLRQPLAAATEALTDLSGGVPLIPALAHPRSEKFRPPWHTGASPQERAAALERLCDALWRTLDGLLGRVGAEVVAASAGRNHLPGGCGLQPGSVYRILEVAMAESPDGNGPLKLLRLHSPYCDTAWNGAWGLHSPEWEAAPQLAAVLTPRTELDGSFWIEYIDFLNHFEFTAAVKMFTGWNELSLHGRIGPAEPSTWYKIQIPHGSKVFLSMQHRDPRITRQDILHEPALAFKVVAAVDLPPSAPRPEPFSGVPPLPHTGARAGSVVMAPVSHDHGIQRHISHPTPQWSLCTLPAGTYHVHPMVLEGVTGMSAFTLRVFAQTSFVLVEEQGPSPPPLH